MAEAALQPMTVAEFLDFDDGTDTRYELIGGAPVAMSPPEGSHVEITTRLVATFARLLTDPCRPIVTGGVAHHQDDTTFRLPDLFVSCAPAPPSGLVDQPRPIIELLSPSTEREDRTAELDFYETLASLRAILFVCRDTRRIALHERGDDAWIVRNLIGSGTRHLRDLTINLDMDEVYAPCCTRS